MKVEVVPGEIIINDLVLRVDEPDFKVIEGDLRSKYPGGIMHGGGSDHVSVYLYASDRTLYTSGINGMTIINITTDAGGHWMVLAEAARYSLYVVMWRMDHDGRVVWSSGDQNSAS